MSEEELKVCGVNEFHSKKKSEKEKYLEKIGPLGRAKLGTLQVNELMQELQSLTNNMTNRVQSLISIKPDDICLSVDIILSKYKWANKKIEYNHIANKQKSIFQYTIFTCELGENIGYEKNKTRPVLVLSKNPHMKNVILVAPITTTKVDGGIPLKYTKFSKVCGYVDLNSIRTVDKTRLDKTPLDRLLFEEEYVKLSEQLGNTIVPLQITINDNFKKMV